MRPSLLILLGGCSYFGTTGSTTPAPTGPATTAGTTSTPAVVTTPTFGTTTSGICDPLAIEAGAPGIPGPVVCPITPDAQAIGDCTAGGWAALSGGVGFAVVQAAIDATPAGGTVVVCPGTHDGELVLDGKALVAADPTPDATVIAGHLEVTDATVQGLTLRATPQAWALQHEGIVASGDVTFECLTAGAGGWVASLEHRPPLGGVRGSLTVRHSTFEGIVTARALAVEQGSTLVVEDSSFTDNESAGYGGPALHATGPTTLRRTTFARNGIQAGWGSESGGAIMIDTTWEDPTAAILIEDCLFEDNTTGVVDHNPQYGRSGGAIVVDGSFDGAFVGTVTVARSTFRRNIGIASVGAIAVNGGSTLIHDSTFEANESGSMGVVAATNLELERVLFADNVTADLGADPTPVGGAVFTSDTALMGATGWKVVALRNTGPDGAVGLTNGGTFACTCCDFGSGADDNSPVDLTHDGVKVDELPLDSSY